MKATFDPDFRLQAGQPLVAGRYRRGRGQDAAATCAALAVVGGIGAAILLSAPIIVRKAEPRPVVVTLQSLPMEPPPVEQPRPEVETPPPLAQIVTPPPQVTLPPPIAAPVLPQVAEAPPPAPAALPAPALAPAAGPANGGDISARVLAAEPPRYPLESRRLREQGTVVLNVLLAIDGRVADIDVAQSSGFVRLDKAALEAVRRWRWAPFQRDGAAVMVRGFVTIPFILSGGRDRGDRHGRRPDGDRRGGARDQDPGPPPTTT